MEVGLFSIADGAPGGFTKTDSSLKDLPSPRIALYASNPEQAMTFIKSCSDDLCGVIITSGASFSSSPLNSHFWHLELPPEELEMAADIAVGFIETIGCEGIPSDESYESLQNRISMFLRQLIETRVNIESLQKKEAELRQIHSLAHIGSWKWDLKTGTVTLSPELCRIYSISLGKQYSSIDDFIEGFTHPDDIDAVWHNIQNASGGRATRPLTYRIIRPDGEIRWVAEPGPDVLLSGEGGKPIEILGIQQDITDQKRAEDDLVQSEMKLREAARNMPGVVFQFYIFKTGKYGMDFVSGNVNKVFGLTDDTGDIFESLVGGIATTEAKEKFFASIDRAVSSNEGWNFEIPYRKPTGELIHLRGSSVPVMTDDAILFNGVLLDVTEKWEAVERIEHLNSLLLAIRNVNQLIVQERSIDDLMRRACSMLVETRSYKDVTVALLDQDQGLGKLFQAGESSYPKMRMLSDTLPECIASALESGKYEVRRDGSKCKKCHYFGEHGSEFHPTFVAPLKSELGISGVLFVALDAGTMINEEECGLLEEVAMDLAYALEKFSSEDELVNSELRYRTLFDSSHDAIMTLDPPSWKFTSGNPAILQMFGVSSVEEFTSMGPWELSPEFQPDGRTSEEKAKEMIEKAMEEGSNYFQWDHMRMSGDVFPATVLLTRVNMKSGSFLQATVRDITKQKAMEDALMRSEQKIRDIANSVPGVIFQFHDGQRGSYVFSFVSERAEELLGISADPENFFERFTERIPPEHLGTFFQSLENAVREDEDWEHTTPFLKPSGDLIWLRGMSIPTALNDEKCFNGVFIDITELVKAEEALRNERDYSASIIRGTPAIVCGISPEGITRFMNPAGEKITGYKNDEITGSNWWKVFYPGEEYEQVEDLFKNFSKNGDVRDYEMTLTTRNGQKRVISWNSLNRRDDNGSITEIIGFGFDVTERKRAEKDLEESEKLFRSVVENAPAGIFLVDTEYRIIYSNEQLCRISGYSLEEIIGMDFRTVLDESSREKVIDRYRRRQQGEEVESNYEISVLKKDGEKRHVVVYVDHIIDPAGNARTLGEIIDITERKKAEQELKRLRNYMANIIDSMPSVLIGVSKKGTITLWNSWARKRTGLETDKVLGRKLQDAVPWLRKYLPLINESIESRNVKYHTKENTSTETMSRYEDLTIYPLVADSVEGAVIRLDDVTEKVRLEEMMVQSEKMLSVGGLAAGMAHEINNPLAGMMQNAEVILRRVMGDLPENRKAAEEVGTTVEAIRQFLEKRNIIRQLKLIHDSGTRAATIVRNMLSFARKSEAKSTLTDLAELMDRTIELAENDYDLKKKYDFKHVEIRKEYSPDTPPVMCERSKIQQVFLNILRNGTEAMHESRFRTGSPEEPCFILRIRKEAPYIVTEIEDNGPGVPEGLRTRIFEPFFTTKDVGIGTGLGLSVSYFIVTEDHEGELEVESVPGRYTRFIVRLPMIAESLNE